MELVGVRTAEVDEIAVVRQDVFRFESAIAAIFLECIN